MSERGKRRRLRQALNYVNEVRARLDLPAIDHIRGGTARKSDHCPLALSFAEGMPRDWVVSVAEAVHISRNDGGEPLLWESMPFSVVQFQRDVDNLEYRELLQVYPDCVPCHNHPWVM